jgi:hypothetical protein
VQSIDWQPPAALVERDWRSGDVVSGDQSESEDQLVATAGKDKRIIVWDARRGRQKVALQLPKGKHLCVV